MPQGGVLYVLVKRALGLPRKPLHRGRFGKRKTALRMCVAGQEKRSPTAKGEEPIFPEPLVFLLGARPPALSEHWQLLSPRSLHIARSEYLHWRRDMDKLRLFWAPEGLEARRAP